MPTQEEMAKAYVEQIKLKADDLTKQLEVLRRHLKECEEEFTNEVTKESE
tara:strand:- start:121 stop:270 length:150 start_codon:yes stop_codon:yes gene_type:complete